MHIEIAALLGQVSAAGRPARGGGASIDGRLRKL